MNEQAPSKERSLTEAFDAFAKQQGLTHEQLSALLAGRSVHEPKELLPRLRDGAAACLRSMARHTGEIQEMFHVLALLMTDAGDEIERRRANKCDCNIGACSKCSTAPVTEIVGEPSSAVDTSYGGSARAVTEQSSHEPPAAPGDVGYAETLEAIRDELGQQIFDLLHPHTWIRAVGATAKLRPAPPPVPDDLKEATRLLHVLYAWYWRPVTESDSARADSLYPARGVGSYSIPLFAAIKALLDRYPYGGPSLTKPDVPPYAGNVRGSPSQERFENDDGSGLGEGSAP